MAVVELMDVYADYGQEEILHGISFSLEQGRRLAILGPNGSGKTTLLRVIAGLLHGTGGVRVDGREIGHMKRKELAGKVALMSQLTAAGLPYCVYDTVMLGRYLHMPAQLFARPSDRDRQVVEESIRTAGLEGMEGLRITELSGGQLQRVYLARTLAQEPSVILLDEPTSHLDLKYQTELVDYLRDWAMQEGHTVIGVMHDLPLAMRLADTVLLLKDGKKAAFGPAEEVMRPELLKEVYGMDVAGYLRDTLRQLEGIINGKEGKDGNKGKGGKQTLSQPL